MFFPFLLAPPPPPPPGPSPDALACAAAALGAPLMPLAERFGHISKGCAGLFRDPVCRKAWETAGEQPPHSRAGSLIETCRTAYCPKLQPRPSLCAGDLTPSRMMAEASALVRAVLERDHGPEFAAAMAALVQPARASAPTTAPSRPLQK